MDSFGDEQFGYQPPQLPGITLRRIVAAARQKLSTYTDVSDRTRISVEVRRSGIILAIPGAIDIPEEWEDRSGYVVMFYRLSIEDEWELLRIR